VEEEIKKCNIEIDLLFELQKLINSNCYYNWTEVKEFLWHQIDIIEEYRDNL